jgi:peptidoglycan/xylan/chitin deacetylase (PgdA/CDA1 family)
MRAHHKHIAYPPVAGVLIAALTVAPGALAQSPAGTPSPWPSGKRAAVSLSFDDARQSQLTEGVPLLNELGLPVTFYLTARDIGTNGAGWKAAAAAGHELGNHSMVHPCTGHFPWSRTRAIEDYSAVRLEAELIEANRAIEAATGVAPVTFAYPCGQTFFGRGAGTTSYIPLVSRLFLAGRGFYDEVPNDLGVLDLGRVLGVSCDDKTFEELKPLVDQAVSDGRWLVLAGHDIGTTRGPQVTRVETLRALAAYLKDSSQGIWVDTVAHVAARLKPFLATKTH